VSQEIKTCHRVPSFLEVISLLSGSTLLPTTGGLGKANAWIFSFCGGRYPGGGSGEY
jgi:hypothetical protein